MTQDTREVHFLRLQETKTYCVHVLAMSAANDGKYEICTAGA